MYYAIRNKRTKKYISGTDFRYHPPHQIPEGEYHPPKLFAKYQLKSEILCRRINMTRYEVIAVGVVENKVSELDTEKII